MATHFEMISDSDTESDREDVVQTQPVGRLAYWFSFDDDEDKVETKQAVVATAAEKAEDKLERQVDAMFDLLIEVGELDDEEEAIADLSTVDWAKLSAALSTALGIMEKSRIIGVFSDLLPRLLQIAPFMEKLTRGSISSSEQWKEVRPTMKKISQAEKLVETLRAAATMKKKAKDGAADDDDSEGDDDDQEHNEQYYTTQLLSDAVKKNKRHYEVVARDCTARGFTSHVISAHAAQALFHLTPGTRQAYVTETEWRNAFVCATKCIQLLEENPNISVRESSGKGIAANAAVVTGGLRGLVQTLYVQLRHIGQALTVKSESTATVVMWENDLLGLTDSLLASLLNKPQKAHPATVQTLCTVLLEIVGPRRQAAHDLLFPELTGARAVVVRSVSETLTNILRCLLKDAGERESSEIISRYYCHHAFQMALDGEYLAAREVLLRAGFPDKRKISDDFSDKSFTLLPSLYNRTIAQIGLSAFLVGDVKTAYPLLDSVYQGRNGLLLQFFPTLGSNKEEQLTDEQFLEWRDALTPSHNVVNDEQLEVAMLLSALIVNLTSEAVTPYNASTYSSALYSIIRQDQVLMGKTKNFRIQIRLLYKVLKQGNFHEAKKMATTFSAWDAFPNKDRVIEAYVEALKVAALKIFCNTNRCNFTSIAVEELQVKYDLPARDIRRALNEMIANEELIAYWDEDDKFLFFDRNNATQIQYMVMETSRTISEITQYTQPQENFANDANAGNKRQNQRNRHH